MKIKRTEASALYDAIVSVRGKSGSGKWSYGMAKNFRALTPEIESIREAFAPTKEFLAFERARVTLAEKLADKDENGRPIITPNQTYSLSPENAKKFEEELATLRTEHADAIAAREQQMEEMDSFMEEEIEVGLWTVDADEIPDGLTPEEVDGIAVIIAD